MRPNEVIFHEKENPLHAFIGFEASGTLHLGHYLALKELTSYHKKGAKVTVLISDVHAQLNLKKDVERNTLKTYSFLKLFLPRANLVKLSQALADPAYWNLFFQFSTNVSFKTIYKALPLQTKKLDLPGLLKLPYSVFLYPLLQCIDGVYHKADLLIGGIDQVNIYMPIFDNYNKLGWPKPMVHLLPLIGIDGKVCDVENKMSSSKNNIPLDGNLYQALGRQLDGHKTFLTDIRKNEMHLLYGFKTFEAFALDLKNQLEPLKDFIW